MESNFVRDHSTPTERLDHLSNVTFGPTSQGALMSQNKYLREFNQLAIKQKLNARFELLSAEGMSHNLVFNYVLHVDDSKYNGSGSTKKVAQNQAAKAYFDSVAKEKAEKELQCAKANHSEGDKTATSVVYTRIPLNSNYIGQLHELCAKSNLKPPNYEFIEDTATKIYKGICKVGDMETEGESASKKEAKKICSMNMIAEIEKKRSNAQSETTPTDTIKEPTEIKRCRIEEKVKLIPLDSTHKKEITSFRKTLTKTNDLKVFLMDLDVFSVLENHHEKMLLDMAKVHGFQVSYEASGTDGDSKVWIAQLGAFPVIVTVGIGKTDDEAKNDASKNVLIYLKALLK